MLVYTKAKCNLCVGARLNFLCRKNDVRQRFEVISYLSQVMEH